MEDGKGRTVVTGAVASGNKDMFDAVLKAVCEELGDEEVLLTA